MAWGLMGVKSVRPTASRDHRDRQRALRLGRLCGRWAGGPHSGGGLTGPIIAAESNSSLVVLLCDRLSEAGVCVCVKNVPVWGC